MIHELQVFRIVCIVPSFVCFEENGKTWDNRGAVITPPQPHPPPPPPLPPPSDPHQTSPPPSPLPPVNLIPLPLNPHPPLNLTPLTLTPPPSPSPPHAPFMFVCVYVCMCVCVCVCLCVYNRHRDAYAAFPLQGAERIGSARVAFPPPKVGVTRT